MHGLRVSAVLWVNSATVEGIQIMPDSIETTIYAKPSLIENELIDIKTLLRTPKRVVRCEVARCCIDHKGPGEIADSDDSSVVWRSGNDI